MADVTWEFIWSVPVGKLTPDQVVERFSQERCGEQPWHWFGREADKKVEGGTFYFDGRDVIYRLRKERDTWIFEWQRVYSWI